MRTEGEYLFGVHYIHDHAALQHARQAFLDGLLVTRIAVRGGAIGGGQFSSHCETFSDAKIEIESKMYISKKN